MKLLRQIELEAAVVIQKFARKLYSRKIKSISTQTQA